MNNKPFAESCEQNKFAILEVLETELNQSRKVLEIGSGTGQHAVFFARQLPYLSWQTSELAENIPGVLSWIRDVPSNNIIEPLQLNCLDRQWPEMEADTIFSANTLHIMPWEAVIGFFRHAGKILPADGLLLVYGPFNYNHQFTSESNARFDVWLKERGAHQGIRNFEDLNALAAENGLTLKQDHSMPANNRILVWQKQNEY